jgi:predicted ABC-type ATPase
LKCDGAAAHARRGWAAGQREDDLLPVTAFGVDAFNIDDRCAQIQGSFRGISREVRRAVAKECERFVLDHIGRGSSFAVEKTLRTTAAIVQAELVRKRGFATSLRFVATDSIVLNVARVLQRAQAGGHGALGDLCELLGDDEPTDA